MVGIKVTATIERTIYLEDCDNVIEKAKEEVPIITNQLHIVSNFLKDLHTKTGIPIPRLDVNDWDAKNIEYTLIDKE